MAAPIGNKFYLLRSKHGRDKLFNDPQLLLDTAIEYFEWCDAHPWIKKEQKKGNTNLKVEGDFKANKKATEILSGLVEIPTQRPYTFAALCLYLGCTEETFHSYGKDQDKKDFFEVVHTIEAIVRNNQMEGAIVGAFKDNIIARMLGLIDKKDISNMDGSLKPTTIIVNSSESKAALDNLMNEHS